MARKSRRTQRLRVVNLGVRQGSSSARTGISWRSTRNAHEAGAFVRQLFTRDLEEMYGVAGVVRGAKVAMESTSVYWIPVYERWSARASR